MSKPRLLALALLAASAMPGAAAAAAEQADHVHLAVTLALAPSQPLAAGDIMGLYAMEMLACPDGKPAAAGPSPMLVWLDRLSDMLMSSAWANHRDRFDRPGARIVALRVPLQHAARFDLGRLTVAHGRYCSIRLTLTRLPAVTTPKPLPPLAHSLLLARPDGQPALSLSYAVALELPLDKPWLARQGDAALNIRLDPAAARPVLADIGLSEGALVQQLQARWAAHSTLRLSPRP